MTRKPTLSALLVLKPHSYGGTELAFLRLIELFAASGWSITVDGIQAQTFFAQYSAVSTVCLDCTVQSRFDAVLCAGIAVKRLLSIADAGVTGDRVIIWALGENGFLENLAVGYGLRFRFGTRTAAWFEWTYQNVLGHHLEHAREFARRQFAQSALVFSDEIGRDVALGGSETRGADEGVVPIPVPIVQSAHESPCFKLSTTASHSMLSVGWIGRISKDFKVFPLLAALEAGIEYSLRRGLTFRAIIIGNGDGVHLIDELRLRHPPSKVSIELKGFVPIAEACRVMKSEVQMMVGMGTAAIDAARCGLPSVIVNPAKSVTAARRCRYRWIYESQGFSLGEFVEYGNSQIKPGRRLDSLLDELFTRPAEVAHRCFAYSKRFDEGETFRRLQTLLGQSGSSLSQSAQELRSLGSEHRTLAGLVSLAKRIRRILSRGHVS